MNCNRNGVECDAERFEFWIFSRHGDQYDDISCGEKQQPIFKLNVSKLN